MGKFTDLTGRRFSRLTVLELVGKDSHRNALWRCVCDCGSEIIVSSNSLNTGNTKSCGCLRIEQARQHFTKHGHSKNQALQTTTYNSWQAMKQRCLDPNAERFPKYGALGVTVCDRWQGEHGFETFLADLGERPKGTTLGRFGDVGNYEPGNVKWMTSTEQRQNWRPDRNLGGRQKQKAA